MLTAVDCAGVYFFHTTSDNAPIELPFYTIASIAPVVHAVVSRLKKLRYSFGDLRRVLWWHEYAVLSGSNEEGESTDVRCHNRLSNGHGFHCREAGCFHQR